MKVNTTKEDLLFSEIGDFIIENGDLKDTRYLRGIGFIEEVESRLKSSTNDWTLNPDYGANIGSFRGLSNSKVAWRRLEDSISYALTQDGFLLIGDFSVFAIGINESQVAVKIVFSDNIRKDIDYKIQDVRIVFDLLSDGPRIMRS